MNALPAEEHERRLALYNKGLTDAQMANLLFLSVAGVRHWRERCGLRKWQKEKQPDARADAVAKLHGLGLNDREIGERLNVKSDVVRWVRKKIGLPVNDRRGGFARAGEQ